MTRRNDDKKLPSVRVLARAVPEARFGRSKEQGTRFVRVLFLPEEAVYTEDGQHGVKPGIPVAWDGWFTEQTVERTIDSLKLSGWDGRKLSKLRGLGSTLVSITVEFEQGERGTFARVAWVNRPGAPQISDDQTLGANELDELEVYARNAYHRGN